MSITVMKQALEYIERHAIIDGIPVRDALRQAIEQEEKVEPVGYIDSIGNFQNTRLDDRDTPIYTTPPTAPASDWNKRIRDSVDTLLAQAGYAEDSSARHQLACMNFDAAPAQPSNHTEQPLDMVKAQQPLPGKQIEELAEWYGLEHMDYEPFARAIEQAHGIKGASL